MLARAAHGLGPRGGPHTRSPIVRVLSNIAYLLGATVVLHAAAYYVDCRGGKDANDGTSPDRAWRTLAQVNLQQFRPAETIHLKRSCSWHETLMLSSSGAEKKPITVTAYGEGSAPTIQDGDIGIDNNEQSHIVYDGLDLRGSVQGLRLYSWNAEVSDIILRNSMVATRPAPKPGMVSAGVYASTATGSLSKIIIRGNKFVPVSHGLENWGVYFVKGVSDFRIENNLFAPAGEDAITVWRCAHGLIRGNRGGEDGENTIDVKDSAAIDILDNVARNDREYNIVVHGVESPGTTRAIRVMGNQCIGGGQGARLVAGIALLFVQQSSVVRNYVEEAVGEGILIHDAEVNSGNLVRENVLRRNGTRQEIPAIVLQDSPGTQVYGNRIQP